MPIPLYAATTNSKVARILERGLSKPFLLTDQLDWASEEAYDLATVREDEPVVLQIDADEKNLSVDWDAYDNPRIEVALFYQGLETGVWEELIKQGKVPYPKNDRDWKTALKTVHVVRHEGPVSPEQIIELDLGDSE